MSQTKTQLVEGLNINTSAPADALAVDNSGNVGIGTTQPDSNLEIVNATASADNSLLKLHSSASTSSANLILEVNNGSTAQAALRLDRFNNFHLQTYGDSALRNRLTIDGNGNVGIGTTVFSAPLTVRGGSSTASTIHLEGGTNGVDNARISCNQSLSIACNNAGNNSGRVISFYNGTSTLATIDSSGRLLVGASSSRNVWSAPGLLQVETVNNARNATLVNNAANANPATITLGKSRGTSLGSSTIVSNGDELGVIAFAGADGSDLDSLGATISCVVDGIPGADDMPALLVFSTTADGASSPSERMRIRSNGNIEIAQNTGSYSNALTFGGGAFPAIWRQGGNGSGIHFTTNATIPANENGNVVDNSESLGIGSIRWTTVYATNGSINTSDANEKQDIQSLSASELAVARELKNLIKKFRWRDAVAKKGDNARIHVGVIAQEVQQLFADHGLDATKYALWCSDTWYEVDGKAIASDGSHYTADSEGAVAKTRLGIRYEELLAFVLAAL